MKYDLIIIGAGIVGLSIAFKILEANQNLTILLVEKKESEGRHQSSHNSGVLRSGLFYKPGSNKSKLSVKGIRLMI